MTDGGSREDVARRVGQTQNGFYKGIFWVYAHLLRLYPRAFTDNYGAEMLEVFTLAAQDAIAEGLGSVLSLLYRELVDLPVSIVLEHIHQRRKTKMQLIRYENSRDVQSVRLLARGLSLVFVALGLFTFVNYAIGRGKLTPAGLVLDVLTVTMLLAWRWEKVGGNLTMGASPLGLISAVYMLRGMSASDPFGAFLVGLAMSAAALIVGWLFVSVAQHSSLTARPGIEPEISPRRRILTFIGIALVVIVLLAVTLFSGPYQETRGLERGVQPVVTMYAIETAIP
jgi:hypothetical protein